VEATHSLLISTTKPDKEQALLGYALGKTLDTLSRYSEALKAWKTANQSREAPAGSFDSAD